ncbi:MAG: KEOPS complex subunit Pcc1 [Nitrososphaerales archaeon]
MSQRRFNAKIEIRTKNSQIIFFALKPEINYSVGTGATSGIKLVDDTIFIDINSNDLSQLRASLNSFLRLVKTGISCLDVRL